MSDQDREKERRATNAGTEPSWAKRIVTPTTLKAILTTGQLVTKIVQVILQLVALFKN